MITIVRDLVNGLGFSAVHKMREKRILISNFDPLLHHDNGESNGPDTEAMLTLLRESGFACELTIYTLFPHKYLIVMDV